MINRVWGLWIVLTLMLATLLFWTLRSEDKSVFLIGTTSNGHHQIEQACTTCHVSPFGGREILQTACEGCHAEELQAVRDSHPESKFTDPANADRVAVLDARYCVTCHREHREEITDAMGVTVPADVCLLCHEDIGKERATHAGLGFDTCASSGCHNFHDNTALYEDFLFSNAGQPWLLASAILRPLNAVEAALLKLPARTGKLQVEDASAPASALQDHALVAGWQASAHALVDVNCNACHGAIAEWVVKPGLTVCEGCHETQAAGFLESRHGMRIASGLEPMTPQLARIPMHADATQSGLTCTSCHGAHDTDISFAAVDACQGCHASTHSQAYTGSPHDMLRLRALAGQEPEAAAVSCATCHLPRVTTLTAGVEVTHVQHNQNATLRPRDKMLRSVCMNCHSLEFSIDALADQALVDNNFNGRPTGHVESIDMVLRRRQKTGESPNR